MMVEQKNNERDIAKRYFDGDIIKIQGDIENFIQQYSSGHHNDTSVRYIFVDLITPLCDNEISGQKFGGNAHGRQERV